MLSGLISNKSISSTSPRNPFTFPIFFLSFCVVCALQDKNHHLIHQCTVQHCTVLHTQAFQSASEKPLQQTRTFSEISLGAATSLGKKASESTISGAKGSKASIIPPEVFCNCKKPVYIYEDTSTYKQIKFTYVVRAKGQQIGNMPARRQFRILSHWAFRIKPQWDSIRNEASSDPSKPVSDISPWGINRGNTVILDVWLISTLDCFVLATISGY